MFSALLVGLAALYWYSSGKKADVPPGINRSEVPTRFAARCSGRDIIKWAVQDLNNDGREDLIMIYRISPEKNMMRVILDLEGGFSETNEVPAPHSNQVISFRDIDRKPPMEIVVQGTRGTKFGYAIFRVEGTELTDLFGEGMEGCC
ncbi:MAG: hypothetical protein LLG06_16320 [Desulfobacteraceae bacterium]|nr:hypothetical protein [Desulfobacteraceae bacterium]